MDNLRPDQTPVPDNKFLGSRQRRLLADSLHIEEELVPTFVRSAMLVVAGFVVAFVVWAGFTELPEIAKAPALAGILF